MAQPVMKDNIRPNAATWKLRRDRPLGETVREATKKTVEVYEDTLRKLAKY